MKIFKLLMVTFLSMNIHALSAQDYTIKVNNKGKVGFVDAKGNEVVKCKYESAFPFSEGVAVVVKSGKYGVINDKGKEIVPTSYDIISPWAGNLFLVKKGKKCGLVNKQGKVVLPANYTMVSKPNKYGKALIAKGGKQTTSGRSSYLQNAKFGIIEESGKVLIPASYKGLYEFASPMQGYYPYYEGTSLKFTNHCFGDTLETDCAYVGYSKNGFSTEKAGILDGNGKIKLKEGVYTYVMEPKSDMVRCYTKEKKRTKCGYHNLQTGKGFTAKTFPQQLKELNFFSHGDFCGSVAPVNGETWSFIDKSGKELHTGYSNIRHSSAKHLWAAEKGNAWDVFDEDGKLKETLSGYEDIILPLVEGDDDIFCVKKNGKYGAINNNGNKVLDFDYDGSKGMVYGTIGVCKDGKWGILSTSENTIVPIQHNDVKMPDSRNATHYWVMEDDLKYHHYNVKSGKTAEQGFVTVTNFVDGVALVVPENMVVENTTLNRALLFPPLTDQKTINTSDVQSQQTQFFFLLDENDEFVIQVPVTSYYKDAVLKKAKALGKHKLSEREQKDIILSVTRDNRSYDMQMPISETEWNY